MKTLKEIEKEISHHYEQVAKLQTSKHRLFFELNKNDIVKFDLSFWLNGQQSFSFNSLTALLDFLGAEIKNDNGK